MPRGPKGDKRPADVIGAAIAVAKIAKGEAEDVPPDNGKDPAAKAKGARREITESASAALETLRVIGPTALTSGTFADARYAPSGGLDTVDSGECRGNANRASPLAPGGNWSASGWCRLQRRSSFRTCYWTFLRIAPVVA